MGGGGEVLVVVMSDTVVAQDIEAMIRIGCTEAERAYPQRLLVTVRADTDTRKVAASLDLTHSICYATICQMVRELAESRSWTLCEEYAERVSVAVLDRFPVATGVRVGIKKFILPGVAWTGIEIFRKRA